MMKSKLLYIIEVLSFCLLCCTHIIRGAVIDVGPSTAISTSLGSLVSLWCKVNTPTAGLFTIWRKVDPVTLLSEDCITIDSSKYSVNPCDQTNHNFTLVISNVQFSDAGIYRCVHSGVQSQAVTVSVNAPPQGTRFLNSTSGLKAIALQDTTFLCETKAYPAATVTWEIDGTTVTSGVTNSNSPRDTSTQLITTTSTLTHRFQKVSSPQSVTCKASNIASGSTPASITVNVDVIWPVESVSINCSNTTWYLQGDVVYCQCQTVGGNPAGMVKWTDITAHLSPYTLRIDVTRVNNHKVYNCEGYNDANVNRPNAVYGLKVSYPPSNVIITSNPAAPLLAGRSPTLTCEANEKGNPAPNYHWWNSTNNDITGSESAGKSVVTIGPLTDIDNGQIYHCEAYNYYTTNKPSNRPSTTYTLNVEFNPIILATASPSSVIREGDDITLSCDVTKANPAVSSYVWSRTGNRNNGVHSQASYPITGIQVGQNGTYTCYATAQSSSHGTLVGESSVALTVKYLHVSVASIPATLENSSVSIHCIPEGIPGTFTYNNWKFQPLTGGSSIDLQRNQNPLVLNNIQYTDAGSYICTVTNNEFTKNSSGTLTVRYTAKRDPSSERVTNLEVSADIGEPATLTLFVIAHPKPSTYTWSKINGSLPSGHTQTDMEFSSTLRIDSLVDSDYGVYECTVDNGVGQPVFVFKLERKGRPDAPSNLEKLHTSAISVTLKWTSNKDGGYPQTFVVQYKNDSSQWISEPAVPDPGYKQTVMKKVTYLQPDTTYMFRVESRNEHDDGSGKGYSSGGYSDIINVKTKVRPVFSKDESKLLNVVINGDVATVSWTIESGQEDITSYKIKYCEKETSANCKEHTELNSTATSVDIMVEKGKDYTFTLYVYEGDDLILESQPFKQDPVTTPGNPPSVGGIVGGIVGTVSALVVVAVVTVFVMRRRRTQEKKAADTEMAGRSSLVVGNDYNGAAGGVSNPALENGDVEEINPYAESPHVASTNNGRPAIAAKPVIAPKPTKGATGVEGLYAQPDKKKKQEKREPDPSALYAQPEKKKKGKVQDEELKNLYAQPDKNKKKKKIAEPKPSSYEDENPYQNVENQNDLGENPYANVDDERRVQEEEEEEQVEESTKNIGPDGTVYADLAFTRPKGKKPKDEIIRTEEATEYATIDFKRKPPPSD